MKTVFLPLAASALALSTFAAAPCAAQELLAPNGRTAVVRTADLDIASEAGARTLMVRIDTAARRVCAPQERQGLSDEPRLCRQDAVQRAVTKAGAGRLAASGAFQIGRVAGR
ncbi:MAG TPA: UrcA family protein [Caulobacteraceae bacterium]|jgi:UrcA family protein